MMQLAIASVPMQQFRGVYTPAQGWPRGTIFEELELPFTAVPGCAPAREEASCTLDAMRFALTELRLFLDTHPWHKAAAASYRHLADRIVAETGVRPCAEGPDGWDWETSGLPWEKED